MLNPDIQEVNLCSAQRSVTVSMWVFFRSNLAMQVSVKGLSYVKDLSGQGLKVILDKENGLQ